MLEKWTRCLVLGVLYKFGVIVNCAECGIIALKRDCIRLIDDRGKPYYISNDCLPGTKHDRRGTKDDRRAPLCEREE